ncbi:LysE family translocator [Terasakiella sp. A23]|uniref:LysE family translocator n=1 Tax=Terasakiella sp. FCG-A23 TaxID=3080561 RepID=UPI0029542F60|nr:LysE family translocator [Terasakiella sp. A23]MDV7339820.1 LysE family translocator [Terasakiella sp. A23]
MSIEFIVTSLIVVLIPGTGVIYVLTNGLLRGNSYVLSAALGCTLGILPHILASALGVAALLHTSAVAFQFVKYLGAAYLIYLGYCMWKETGSLQVNTDDKSLQKSHLRTVISGILINILNPKLSIFFLAFLPQFMNPTNTQPLLEMATLGGFFMGLTLLVFLIYGYGAAFVRHFIMENPRILQRIQKGFAGLFALLGVRLAMEER